MSDVFDWGEAGKPQAFETEADRRERIANLLQSQLDQLDADVAQIQQRVARFEGEADTLKALIKSTPEYDRVWIGGLNKSYRREAKAMTGKRVPAVNLFRAYDIKGIHDHVSYKMQQLVESDSYFRDYTAIRMTPNQAMLAKLTDRGENWRVHEDPQGLLWGRLKLLALARAHDILVTGYRLNHLSLSDCPVALAQYHRDGTADFAYDKDLLSLWYLNATLEPLTRQRQAISDKLLELA